MRIKTTFPIILFLLFICNIAQSQVFWTEDYTSGCASLCTLPFTSPNGTWTWVSTGANGAHANTWYVSQTEEGLGRGSCGNSGFDASLHIGNVAGSPAAAFFCPNGDCGAAYDASSGDDNTNARATSPVINCTGKTTITLSFNYLMNGQAGVDYMSVWYYNGATWALLASPPITALCGAQGKWTNYTVAMPASANNNPNVQIGFNWQNNADNVGTDPSVAIDSVTLSVPVIGAPPVANFKANDSTICVGDSVQFTDLSTGAPTSWSWTFTGGTPPNSVKQNPVITYNTVGVYTVKEVVKNGSGSDSLTKVAYIHVIAKPSVTVPATTTICAGTNTTLTASGGGTYAWNTGATTSSITVKPLVTTTYSLTVSNGTCSVDTTVKVIVNPLPVVTLSGTTSICAGASTTLTATGGGTYLWTTSSTNASITVTPATTTTYSVSVTNGGCTVDTNMTVTVNALPSLTITPPSPSICTGGNVNLTASGATTYTWKPATALSATTGATVNASPAVTTTYTVVGKNAAGCVDSANVTVTVSGALTAVVTGTTTICSGGSTTLTASGGATYAWKPATGLSSTTSAVVTASPVTTTTYTVVVSSGSCSDSTNVTVTVNPSPIPSISGTTSICAGSNTTLTASGGTSYLWNTGATTAAITVSPATTTSYTVTVGNGTCSVKDSVTVTVNAVPVPTITPPATVCSGKSTTIIAGGGATYSWSPAAGLSTTTGASVTATPAVTTTYSVTVSNGPCSKDTSVTITVNPSPVVTLSGNTTICAGSNTTLTATGGGTYSWSTGSTNAGVTVTPATTTTYSVDVTKAGCTTDTSITVTVDPIPVASISGSTTICSGIPTTLTASGGATFSWSTGATTSAITVNPATAMGYTVTVSNGPCSAKDSVTVKVNAHPNVTACCDTTINIGGTASLQTTATGVTYSWSPANALSCTNCPNPSATPTVNTVYYVTVTDSNGCTNTDSVIVNVLEDCHDPYVPTAFSPNGDGQNDVLYVYGNCIKALDLVIYDRWGNKVFETTDPTVGWDGKFKGTLMNTGEYVYHLVVTQYNGITINTKGNVTLVR